MTIDNPRELQRYVEKCVSIKFNAYANWMKNECHTQGFYFRKPLVKGLSDFDRGEIYLAIDQCPGENNKLIEQFALNVIQLIRDFIGIPLLMRQLDLEYRKTERQKNNLDNILQVMNEPLQQISININALENQAQQLRSIMFAPHRTIFSATELCRKYFIPYNSLEFHGVKWITGHKPAMYKHLKDICLTLIGLWSEVTRCNIEGYNVKELLISFSKLLTDKHTTKAVEELVRICDIVCNLDPILIGEVIAMLQEDEEITLSAAIDKNNTVIKICSAVDNLKLLLFTPHKPSEIEKTWPLLPLLVIIDSYTRNLKTDILYNGISCSINLANYHNELLPKMRLGAVPTFDRHMPLPTESYSGILSFIDDFLAHMKESKKKLISSQVVVSNQRSSITLKFNSYIFNDKIEGPRVLVHSINFLKKSLGLRFESGDFLKPFNELVRQCYRRTPVIEPSNPKENIFVLLIGNTQITIAAECFNMQWEKEL